MWRPKEGLNNPYPTDRAPYVEGCVNRGEIFEAGADAMLEAIVKWVESIQDDEWLEEHPTMGMCLSLDCWEALGGGERARSLFTYNKKGPGAAALQGYIKTIIG